MSIEAVLAANTAAIEKLIDVWSQLTRQAADTIQTVSYTHLDVYKRQPWG